MTTWLPRVIHRRSPAATRTAAAAAARPPLAITGEFRKDVPRYLRDRTYAEGWGDGFEQCKEQMRSQELREFREQVTRDRDDEWKRDKDRAAARALGGHSD